MGEQSKRVNESKEDEWHLVDEKIFHLQGTRPKTNRKQRLPAVRPAIGPDVNEEKQRNLGLLSRGDRHFQPKSKCSLQSPQELISVDNVSHVTDRKGNKLPYCRTNCAPLPRNSPSKIFPSRVSPCRRARVRILIISSVDCYCKRPVSARLPNDSTYRVMVTSKYSLLALYFLIG